MMTDGNRGAGGDVQEPGPNQARRLIVNAGSNWANLVVTTVVSLALVPFMLARLGAEAYGVWALMAFGLAYPVILERAFANALIRFTAFSGDDVGAVRRYASSTFFLMGGLAVLVMILALAAAPFLPRMFAAVPERYAEAASVVCRLVGATLAAGMLQAAFTGVLKGRQRFLAYNIVMIGSNLLRAGLIVALLSSGRGIVAVQWSYVVAAVVAASGMALVVFRTVDGFALSIADVDGKSTREIWRYTRHSMARSGSRVVMLNTLALLVGWRGTATDVAVYDVASKVPQFLAALMFGAQSPLLPVVSDMTARSDSAGIRSLVTRSTRIHAALIAAAVLWLAFDAGDVLSVWLRGDVLPGLTPLVRILAFSLIPTGVFGLWLPTLVGVGRLPAVSAASILTAAGAILAAWLMMERGVRVTMAPAWAMLGIFVAARAAWLPVYGARAIGMPMPAYLRTALGRPLAATLVVVALLLLRGAVAGGLAGLSAIVVDGLVIVAVFAAVVLRGGGGIAALMRPAGGST